MDVQDTILGMNGGTDDNSYAQNSVIQEIIIGKSKHIIEEAIVDLYKTSCPKSLGIADLGCSSGPNALMAISYALDAIRQRCSSTGPTEVRIFLNDLWGNDFNTLFQSLPAFYDKLYTEKGFEYGQCCIAGVPGSFYGRLFPNQSLDFVLSSSGLHWLSKAYLDQFNKDFSAFLCSRSKEVASGGRMVLTLAGRVSPDPCNAGIGRIWELLADALWDMVAQIFSSKDEGEDESKEQSKTDQAKELLTKYGGAYLATSNSLSLISFSLSYVLVGMGIDVQSLLQKGEIGEKQLNAFNLAFYYPSAEELQDVISCEGSFHLDRVEVIEMDAVSNGLLNKKLGARAFGKMIRAALEPTLTKQFGGAIINELFRRYEENVARHKDKCAFTNLVVCMTKI